MQRDRGAFFAIGGVLMDPRIDEESIIWMLPS